MLGNKVYRGAFSEQLKSFIEEKRMLGCRYVEEERLSYEFDKLSLQYDCSNGLNADLVNEFIKCKPNCQNVVKVLCGSTNGQLDVKITIDGIENVITFAVY